MTSTNQRKKKLINTEIGNRSAKGNRKEDPVRSPDKRSSNNQDDKIKIKISRNSKKMKNSHKAKATIRKIMIMIYKT